jgi:hypothetical protein
VGEPFPDRTSFPYLEGNCGSVPSRLQPSNGKTAIGLEARERYIVLVMIREFFDFLSFIALLVPWVLIIMSIFM